MMIIMNHKENSDVTFNQNKLLCRMLTLLVIYLTSLLSVHIQASACTIFSEQTGDSVLVGNNEDWMYSIPSYMWLIGAEEHSYGRICFANSSYIQGGMNEKGLFYDGATCPASKVPFTKGKLQLGMDFGEIVLTKCANVQEAVQMVKTINIPYNFSDHIMFADQYGNSAVVEWVENELRIIVKEGNYQIVTNFWLSNNKLGGYPCKRFDTAKEMLEGKNNMSLPYIAEILKATSADWGDGGTKYSNIYDLKSKEVYVYNKADFSKYARYILEDELKSLKRGEKRSVKLDEITYHSETSQKSKVIGQAAAINERVSSVSPIQEVENKTRDNEKNLFDIKIAIAVLMIILIILFIIVMKRQTYNNKVNL